MQFMMPQSRFRTKLFQEGNKSVAEELAVLLRNKLTLDRDVEYPLLEVVREIRTVADSLTIFFCSHGHGSRIHARLLDYQTHVSTGELMMVGELHMSDDVV